MKLLIAGATGVIGRVLLPRLTAAGHDVTALTRSSAREEQIRRQGAKPVVCDVFDRAQLMDVVAEAEPEVVIHQLTSLPDRIDPRKIKEQLASTNRLRTIGTQNLMEAALAAGTRRFIAQSISSYCRPGRDTPASEEEPLYTEAPDAFVEVVDAIASLEQTVLGTPGIEGVVLRYGYFYGPGTVYAGDGTFAEDVRNRRVPIIGNGNGHFSFVHIADAADATMLTLHNVPSGIYNIVDDEPVPLRDWLPLYADILNAPSPMRIPKAVGRVAAGRFGVYYMTEQRGASNLKAKQTLGWQPQYPTWRDGFPQDLQITRQLVVA